MGAWFNQEQLYLCTICEPFVPQYLSRLRPAALPEIPGAIFLENHETPSTPGSQGGQPEILGAISPNKKHSLEHAQQESENMWPCGEFAPLGFQKQGV